MLYISNKCKNILKKEKNYNKLDDDNFTNKKDFKLECMICFYQLDDNKPLPKCKINDCKLQAHNECIYEWYLRKKCCPICNETWRRSPTKKSCCNLCL